MHLPRLRQFAFCILHFAFCLSALAEPAKRDFPRGATPTPRHKLLSAPQHRAANSPPAQIAYVPKQLDYWGNDRYGDCVTAEEAFAKACYQPEIFVSSDVVTGWARQHGVLDGADLASVMDAMAKGGFQVGAQLYGDGGYSSVDYSDEATLQSAIAVGPVKIAIDADALPDGAGNQQGWYALGDGRQYPRTDHCVSICGYGSASYLYSQLNVPPPANLGAATPGYLVFTWSTIGFVDHAWLMSTCAEAWVRSPTTVGVPPLSPSPSPSPGPSPSPSLSFAEALQITLAVRAPNLTDGQATSVENLLSDGPRVKLLRDLVYHRALRAGVIPAGTPIEAVNWQGLIQFMQALVPVIEELMKLFAGESLPPAVPSPPAPAIQTVQKYRTECTPFGCRRVPVN